MHIRTLRLISLANSSFWLVEVATVLIF